MASCPGTGTYCSEPFSTRRAACLQQLQEVLKKANTCCLAILKPDDSCTRYRLQQRSVVHSWLTHLEVRSLTLLRGLQEWYAGDLLWPPYEIGGAIIFLPCGYYLSIFFPRLISAAGDGCLPYFHTWCGLSANLECRSKMCGTQIAANTGRKNCHFGTITQLCRAVSSQLRHCLLYTSPSPRD